MDIYQSNYWKATIFLQKIVGFWVFQTKQWKNYLSWIYVYSFTISFMTSMMVRLLNEIGINLEIVIENAIGEMYLILIFFKLTASISYRHKLRELYELVGSDWNVITDADELKVMHKYYEIGYMIIGVALFLSMPIFFPFLDYVLPLDNATRPKALPYYAEYGIDIEKYYYPMLGQAIFGGIGTVIVLVTFDLAFMQIVQHVVALFELVNFRLSKAANIADTMDFSCEHYEKKDKTARHFIVQAIELHQTAIKYVEIIEKCYNLAWLVILFFNMVMVGGGMSVFLMKFDRVEELVRYAVVVCACFIHFYYVFTPGQKLINSSTEVMNYCYGCNWYNMSERTKTLVQIMLIRTRKHSEVTGGKMFVLSMDTYCNMMKTGYTIFTVLNT